MEYGGTKRYSRELTLNMSFFHNLIFPLLFVAFTVVVVNCGGSVDGPGVLASIESFSSKTDGRVEFTLKLETTNQTKTEVPYLINMFEDEVLLGSLEVTLGGEGAVKDPEIVFLEVAETGISRMLSDLVENENVYKSKVESLFLDRDKWARELTSMDERLANGEISLVQLGAIQKQATSRVEEIQSELNLSVTELQKWGRWRNGIIHFGEEDAFDLFARRYFTLNIELQGK